MIALARIQGRITAEEARAIVAVSPGDWRAWTTLGLVDDAPPEEKEAADRKAIELRPDNWVALNALAWNLTLRNRSKEALPYANRALDLAPWSAAAVDTLAEIAARLGRCPEARRLIERSTRMAEFNSGREDAGRDRRGQVESRCPAAAQAR